MKLTDEQTRELYEFTLRKRVRYYDVQIEIVDHLACAIEDRLDREPTLPFHEALRLEYKKFGIFGFSKIVTEKMKAQEKNNRHLIISEVKSLFHGIKVLRPILIFLTLYISFQLLERNEIIISFWSIVGLIYTIDGIKSLKIRYSKTRLITLEKFSPYSYDFLCIITLLNVNSYLYKIHWIILFSIIFAFFIYFIAKHTSYQKKIKQAREHFPEIFTQ